MCKSATAAGQDVSQDNDSNVLIHCQSHMEATSESACYQFTYIQLEET